MIELIYDIKIENKWKKLHTFYLSYFIDKITLIIWIARFFKVAYKID